MLDDADTVLNLVGAALVLAIVVGLVVVGLNFAATNGGGDDAPDAEWSIERVNDTHARVTHAGGDPIRTENLRVTVDSLQRSTDWSDPVREGDTTLVDAGGSSLVRIVWNGGRGDRVIMAQERV